MGFDPSSIKPRTPTYDKVPVDAPRDQRVLALAHLLHSRGVTASLADAKRLAEGMVDGEKKVLKDGQPKPVDPSQMRTQVQSSSPFFAAVGVPQQSPSGNTRLEWSADFRRFVDRAAAIGKPAARPSAAPRDSSVSYGRGEEQHHMASVPHVGHNKLVFFADAPSLDRTRGFAGQVEHKHKFDPFTYDKEELSPPSPHEPIVHTEETVVRVEQGDAGVLLHAETITPTVEIVEERGTVALEDAEVVQMETEATEAAAVVDLPVQEEATSEEPVVAAQESFNVQEELAAVEPAAPEPAPQRQTEDLAKQHGIDIFTMFRVKK